MCITLVALSVTGSYAAALVSIDQGPIVRVLRISDVPAGKEGGLPSGALTASQLAFNNDPTAATRRAETRALEGAGFRSSAITRIDGSGLLQYKSTAVELTSRAGAARALAAEAPLCAHSQAPTGTRATVARDPGIRGAILVTFRASTQGQAGGLELLAHSGTYLYTLQAIEEPDGISRLTLERLLKVVMSRR